MRPDGRILAPIMPWHALAHLTKPDLAATIGVYPSLSGSIAEAARRLPFRFTLTGRAENFLRGNPDLDDTIKRLQAFEAAGADVLMAPGLPDLAAVQAVCAALSRPFNFMAGIRGRSFTVAELAQAGVKRISLATSLYRAAMSGLVNAAAMSTGGNPLVTPGDVTRIAVGMGSGLASGYRSKP